MIDMVVPRAELKDKLALLIAYLAPEDEGGGLMADFARSTHPGVQAQLDRLSHAVARRRPARARAHRARCSTGSAGRRTRCRRCSMSPGPTARARPAPSSAPRSKRRARGPRLHQPAPGPLQRAHPHRRAADRRRDARRAADRGARRQRRHRAELLRGRDRGRLPRLRAHAGRRLHPRGRARRPARRDQRHRAPAGHAASPTSASTISNSSATRLTDIAGEKAGIAKRGVPLVTQLYPPRDRRRGSARSRDERGRALAAARRRLGRDRPAAASFAIATSRASSTCPLPRLPGRHQALNAALAVAMLRHQDALARAARRRSARRWAGPTGRRGCSSSRPGRSSATAKSGSTAATIRRPRARSRLRQAPIRRRQAAAPDLRQPRDQGSAPACSSRSRASSPRSTPCRSPTTPASRPTSLPRSPASSASRPTRTTTSRRRSPPFPHDARVLIFGSLYLAGAVLAANDQVPD